MSDNQNISKNGWSEYGRLVLKELERLNEGQEKLRSDLEQKFNQLNEKISDFKNTEKEVDELKEWKGKVTEVWSVTQMKQSKDEIYNQKNMWTKVIGISIGVQAVVGFILYILFKIF